MNLPGDVAEGAHNLKMAAGNALSVATEKTKNLATVSSIFSAIWEIGNAASHLIQTISVMRQLIEEAGSSNTACDRQLDECPICSEALFPLTSVVTPCRHEFHIHCILHHLGCDNNDLPVVSCPLCKTELDESEVMENIHLDQRFNMLRVPHERLDLLCSVERAFVLSVTVFRKMAIAAADCLLAAGDSGSDSAARLSAEKVLSVCSKEFEQLVSISKVIWDHAK